ncbi:hypothetical protein HZA40_03520 [Candidatus Peregrinibacteria bacterium]|nr:hypothetical protein [Candidatus Peregrinibacteria bacterium]
MKTLFRQSEEKAQANFFISVKVLKNLKNHVPARSRSQFVEEIIDKALKKNSFLQALDLSAGSWNSKDYNRDTDKFIRSLRESKR